VEPSGKAQFLLTQSLSLLHGSPLQPAHEGTPLRAPESPQSTPVSLPSCTRSEQLGLAHLPEKHALFAQSALARQDLPLAHFGQELPPQSTAVSLPFCTLSVQLGTRHVLEMQFPVSQSALTIQVWPEVQGVQEPPQSTSVSSPLTALSLHVAPRHL